MIQKISEFKEVSKYHFTFLSSRLFDRWVSHDIVYSWEDAFVKIDPLSEIRKIPKKYYFLTKIFRNHYLLSNKFLKFQFQKLQRFLAEDIDENFLFLIGMTYRSLDFLGFYKTKKLKIVYIIDAWENTIESIAEGILENNIDIVLLAYQDSVELLKEYLPKELGKRVFLFPVFVNPDIYPKNISNKVYDIVQFGRRNEILHQWALQYSLEKNRSYLYQVYPTYSDLINVLAKTKIVLVSPPNLTNNKRTGRVSPLTPRYLEAAMCFAVLVGFTPSSGEYRDFFPETFTIVPKNYDEFVEICDQIIDNEKFRLELASRNYEYVLENHSAYIRYNQLQQILREFK